MDSLLKDLLGLPQIRNLLESLGALQNIPTVIVDREGNLLSGASPCEPRDRCHSLDSAATWRSNLRSPGNATPAPDRFLLHHSGDLVDAGLPIAVAGEVLGYACSGPFFLDAPGTADRDELARRHGLDDPDYLNMLRAVPAVPEVTLRGNLDLVVSLIKLLAEQELQKRRNAALAVRLRENERVFRSIFEKSSDPMLILNCGRIVDCNAATVQLLGHDSKEQLLELRPAEISPTLQPDGRRSEEKAEEMIASALREGYYRFEWIHSKADGSDFPVEVTLTPVTIGGELILHTIWRDITERKQIESELLRSDAKYRTLYDATGDAVFLLSETGFSDCNGATLRMFGCPSLEEFTKAHPGDLSPPLQPCGNPSLELANRQIAKAREKGSHRFEWVHRRTDTGEAFPTEVQLSAMELDGSAVIQGTVRDISERKRSEERVVDAMNYIQTILSASPVGIETFKSSGERVSVNDAAARIVGATTGQLLQQNFRNIESWRRFGMLEAAERALATGAKQQGDFHLVTSFGERVDLECQFVPFLFSGEQQLMLSIMDITERKRAEQRLQYSVSLIDAVFDSTDDGILVVELSGKIARWNRAFLDLWRVPEGLIATGEDSVLEYAVGQMAQPSQFLDKVLDLYRNPEQSSEDLLELADGRLVERYSQPLRIGNEIAGRFWSFRDTTERRKLEDAVRRQNRELEERVSERTRSLEHANCELLAINNELELSRDEAERINKKLLQLSSAVENSSTSIVITDCLGQIEYVNPKFSAITGYRREEVLGCNPRVLKAEGQPEERYRELWETISAGREWSGDLCNRKKNGEVFWEHASISPIRGANGGITSYVAIKEDITEQKRIAGELLSAQEAALSANRAKSEFLANMSHEIRTPLSAIIGFSDLTLRTSLQPRQQEYLQKIQTAGDLLLSIINDILDFSKIEARQLEMEQIPFRLDTVLSNVADIVQQKVNQKSLHLHLETAPDVVLGLVGDQHRLSQIIVNLLSNAVKFTEHGGVALEATQQCLLADRVQLKFRVRDTGIGIPEEVVKKLFQPFTQADGSTTRRFGGTGLGLSISKQLVEMMGGEIWCESTAGKGSTFCFTAWFGLGQPDQGQQGRPAEPWHEERNDVIPDFSGSRVLLVEDNAVNLELASELLYGTGTLVDTAVDGREAVAKITESGVPYDLVLMDLQMPVLDGYQAARQVRDSGRFAELPIIAMTAHAMTEVQQAILDAGMNAIVTKPINSRVLYRVMQGFLAAPEGGGEFQAGSDEAAGRAPTGALPPADGSAWVGSAGSGPGAAAGSAAEPAASGGGQPQTLEVDAAAVGEILNRLLDYIKGSNGKAERYLDAYHREMAGLPEHEIRQIKSSLSNFNFAAAREAILSLARRSSINLAPDHTGES
jgi:PAS domain S-box-containing protein